MLTIVCAIFAPLACGIAIILTLRHVAYRRRISFNPRQDWALGLSGPAIQSIALEHDKEDIFIPKKACGHVSGLLEICVQSSIGGLLFDPSIEIRAPGYYDVQYLERGAAGVRFLNITRLLGAVGGGKITLTGRRVKITRSAPRLHLCDVGIGVSERVLVIAPHPDDAEIAAFGLYSSHASTVVTITAGDLSDRFYYDGRPQLSRNMVAKIRVWDSLTVPRLGGVPDHQAVNLCAPDGGLQWMSSHPDCEGSTGNEVDPFGVEDGDFAALRAMNRMPLVRRGRNYTWNALVEEIAEIIRVSDPTLIITPHPTLDPHVDHRYTTRAVFQAVQRLGSTNIRNCLFPVIHNRQSELWPFGPAGTGVSVPPIFASDGACGSGFYSHSLSAEQERQKFVALESMHDLREIAWPVSLTLTSIWRRAFRDLKAFVQGMGADPTSYFRRAVRPDEFFITASVREGTTLVRAADEAMKASHRSNATAK